MESTTSRRIAHELTEVGLGALGAIVGHWLTEKRDKQGNTIKDDKTGKTKMTIDSDKVRAHAPFFVLGLSDEAEFNGLMAELDSGIQRNMVYQMGPVMLGPALPGQVMPGLGDHERADVILTSVQLNERKDIGTPEEARKKTLKMLYELGSIEDPGEWKRRAVAFRLKKEHESDYLGAKLTAEGAKFVKELAKGKETLAQWLTRNARANRRLRIRQNRIRQAWSIPLGTAWGGRSISLMWLRSLLLFPFRVLRATVRGFRFIPSGN